jgi:hypothetical protein
MPIHRICRVSTCAFLLVPLFCGGCGSNVWRPVSGTVKFDGEPVAEGSISFEPADGKGPSAGGSIQDGEYLVARLMSGRKIVRIVGVRKTGKKVQRPMTGPGGPSGGATIDEVESYIPAIYNTQSTLTCEVVGDGQNRIDFDLKPR